MSIHPKTESNMEEKQQLISTAEAAKFLGMKVSYLHKLMMRRVIPYYKPNGKLCFFDKADLEAWQMMFGRCYNIGRQASLFGKPLSYRMQNDGMKCSGSKYRFCVPQNRRRFRRAAGHRSRKEVAK